MPKHRLRQPRGTQWRRSIKIGLADFHQTFSTAATKSHITIDNGTFTHIEDYNKKWRGQVHGKWQTPLIASVLMDSAAKIAIKNGVSLVTPEHAQQAILEWHGPGSIDICLHAGKKIMKRQKKKPYKFRLGQLAKKFAHIKYF